MTSSTYAATQCHTHTDTHTDTSVSSDTNVCMHVCICVCMCVCMFVCIYDQVGYTSSAGRVGRVMFRTLFPRVITKRRDFWTGEKAKEQLAATAKLFLTKCFQCQGSWWLQANAFVSLRLSAVKSSKDCSPRCNSVSSFCNPVSTERLWVDTIIN